MTVKAKSTTPAPAKGSNVPVVKYKKGAKEPRLGHKNMNDTKRSWETLGVLLKKGPQTIADMQTLLKEKHNHMCFVKYAIKNKWLVAA